MIDLRFLVVASEEKNDFFIALKTSYISFRELSFAIQVREPLNNQSSVIPVL